VPIYRYLLIINLNLTLTLKFKISRYIKIHIEAIGINADSFEVEVDEYKSNKIYIKFMYQDIDEDADFIRKDFIIRSGNVDFTIDLGEDKSKFTDFS